MNDLRELLTTLRLETVDLLGFSTGGQVAQLFVQHYPDLVRRLILASTTAYGQVGGANETCPELRRRLDLRPPRPAWAPPAGDHRTLDWAIDSAPVAIWNLDKLGAYFELLAGVTFGDEWIGPYLAGRLHPWRPTDPVSVLRAFAGPILVLHGAQDMTFPVSVAERLSAEVDNATLVSIENTGHMAHFERPERWAAAVVDFTA